MKKKIIALLLAMALIITVFAACGKQENPDTSNESTTLSAEENKDGVTDGKTDDKTDKEADEGSTTTSAQIATLENTADKNVPFFGAFESETIDGEKVTDNVFKGNKVTMVNVWGTFCSPCIREMPDLQKLSETYESKGVKLIGIVADTYDYTKGENNADKIADAEDIIEQTGVKYMNILPSVSLNSAKLDTIFSFPTTYFLDENGAIIGSEYVGSRSYDQWCQIVDDILERV